MTSSARIVFCPSCGARYEVRAELLAEPPVVLLCGTCRDAARLDAWTAPAAAASEAVQGEDILRDAQMPRVVVGHDVPSSARAVAQVLRAAGYMPTCVRSGVQVLAACDPAMPVPAAAVVLDVAIPDILAFEVIGQLRASPSTAHLPIVLLASVFERTRYKRRPTNLHGADAYLELHHVPDRLPALLREIQSKQSKQISATDGLQAPNDRARSAGMRAVSAVNDDDAARALARRLLSDVALYHGDELSEGVRAGDPFARLRAAVDAARELYLSAAADGALFDDELARFAERLTQQHRGRARSPDG